MDDRFSKTTAAHGIHLRFHQPCQVVDDLFVGDGGTQALCHSMQYVVGLMTKGSGAVVAQHAKSLPEPEGCEG